MHLPPAIAPWAQQLNIFPPEIAVALGVMAPRVAALLGPLPQADPEEQGIPDGVDGIARRGGYERLLMTEWLLAEEHPLEFTRRAAMGEHLFLRHARRQPAAARMSVALFDAGPDQAGAPRLAQMAALIVLARRAREAGAEFYWGVLQRPEVLLHTEINPRTIYQWLESRTLDSVRAEYLQAWGTSHAHWRDLTDGWLIGGARALRLAENDVTFARFARLRIDDALEPEARALSLTAQWAGRTARALRLELPGEAISAHLLRDPFAAVAAPVVQVKGDLRPDSNLLFTLTGSKLLARRRGGGLLAFAIPNSPRAGTSPPKQLGCETGERVLSAGRLGTAMATVVARNGMAYLRWFGNQNRLLPEGYYVRASGETIGGAGTRPLGALIRIPGDEEVKGRALLLDEHGQLLLMSRTEREIALSSGLRAKGSLTFWARDVVAFTRLADGVAHIGRNWTDAGWKLVKTRSENQRLHKEELPLGFEPREVFWGNGSYVSHRAYGLIAIRRDDSSLVTISPDGDVVSFSAPRGKIVGVMHAPGRNLEMAVVTLEDDGHTLMMNGSGWAAPLLRAPAVIEQVTVSPVSPHIAYSTVNGDLIIWSRQSGRQLCAYAPGVRI
ncbi:MAG: hypothetical protein ACKV2V_16225 [Blastocatellia bacterium]